MNFFPFFIRNFFKFLSLVLINIVFITTASSERKPEIVNRIQTPNVTVQTSTPPTPKTTVQSSTSTPARLWNLQDADILSVINEVSQETGKNFVVDPRITGKITLISSKPLKRDEVYQVFLSVLSLLGYSAIPNGDIIKIIPNMESGEHATPLASHSTPGAGDEVVVRVMPLKNVSAAQLIPILRPLLPQWSNISAYAPGNILILLGRAANLERIYNIIQEVDKASNSGIQIIRLKYASAAQMATVLTNLQNSARATGETPSVSIAVDERSNSVLLSGPRGMRLRMRVLIAELDAPPRTPSGNTEVVYLRYLEARTFAPLLGKIAQNILGKDSGPDTTPAPASQPASNSNMNAQNMGGGGSSSNSSSASGNKEPIILSGTIQAEPNTNAVIITAAPVLMTALKHVIAKLDIRPSQVLVEAIIAEIDESNLASLGIQWGSVTPAATDPQGGGGGSILAFPVLGAGIVGLMPHVQIRSVLSILQNQNGVDILSTPSVMVLDNQSAMIEIGQDVPFQSGQYATTNSTTVSPFTTTTQKPVTLKLEVTPQINLGTSVRLKLKLKNDTLANPQNPGQTPTINTSKIQNSVLVNSDDILVLGGLMSNTNNENINRVPILGDIPIIGPLFQQKTKNQSKKTLMVFLKPIIVNNNDEAMILSNQKYYSMRSEQANYREDLRDIGKNPAITRLAPWRNKQDLPAPFEHSDFERTKK